MTVMTEAGQGTRARIQNALGVTDAFVIRHAIAYQKDRHLKSSTKAVSKWLMNTAKSSKYWKISIHTTKMPRGRLTARDQDPERIANIR